MKDSASTSQPGSSAVSGCRNSSQSLLRGGGAFGQLLAAALAGMDDMGARAVGDFQGAVAGPGIADDHLAHHPAHRRRDQAVETARQQALGIDGGDDD